MKTYTNFKNNFLMRVFGFKFIFLITFIVPILDLMTVFHLKGYTTVVVVKNCIYPFRRGWGEEGVSIHRTGAG